MTLAVTKQELMNKLGVGRDLRPYETMPWSCYDADKETTCSAEIRMDGMEDMLEGEIQMMYDNPDPDQRPMEQICHFKADPSRGQWTITWLRIRGEPFGEDVYDWQSKTCDFFLSVVQHLKRDEVPDIDELLDQAYRSRERFSDQHGGGGGKSPKVRGGQLLNNKGKGF